MSANRLFLVCKHHPSFNDALCLAERSIWLAPYEPAQGFEKRAEAWFERHKTCVRDSSDHFQLAMHRPADHDRPVQRVSTAVKLALVQSILDEERAMSNKLKGSEDVEILD